MTDDTQAVVDEANASAQPDAAVDSARTEGNDLETLLAQWDKETVKTVAADPPASVAEDTTTDQKPSVPDPAISRIANRLFQQDLDAAVSKIVGDLPVPKRLATGWIDQMARENPAVRDAFMAHHNGDSARWERLEPALAKQFAKEIGQLTLIDKNATEDRAIVAAAVRGASTKAPSEPPPNYSRATNAEFRKEVIEKYGFDPGV